jgi:hypothetical protein
MKLEKSGAKGQRERRPLRNAPERKIAIRKRMKPVEYRKKTKTKIFFTGLPKVATTIPLAPG